MGADLLQDYQARTFTAPLSSGHEVTHDIYTASPEGDDSASIIIIQEMPGIGPETISLANTFVERGFRVVLPHLFGPLGRISLGGNTVRVLCMRKEFRIFEKHQTSPVVDWLRALCADLVDNHNARGVGVIGMCLTGNFAISMMADANVLAAVASQPSMPIMDQHSLHMSSDDVAQIRTRLDEHGPMLALRFTEDKLCTHAKFKAIGDAFNDDRQRIKLIELTGPGHSVLTLDLYKGGQPAQDALAEVIAYFTTKLKTA